MCSNKIRKKNNPVKVGDVFPINSGGTVTVTEYKNAKEVYIVFNDKHQHRSVTQAVRLREGMIFNPYNPSVAGRGYLGHGKYCTSLSGENKKIIEY